MVAWSVKGVPTAFYFNIVPLEFRIRLQSCSYFRVAFSAIWRKRAVTVYYKLPLIPLCCRIPSEQLYRRGGIAAVKQYCRRRLPRWVGHVSRRPMDRNSNSN